MYAHQLQALQNYGDRRPNKCKFPFDGTGRTYGLVDEENDLWRKVVRYFLLLSINPQIFHDEKLGRYFCTVYLYQRTHCNKHCPAYESVNGVSTSKTVSDKEEKDKKNK